MIAQQFCGRKVLVFLVVSYFVVLVHISSDITRMAELSLFEDGFEGFQVEPDKGSDYDFAVSRYENLTEGTEVRRSQTEDTSPCSYSDEAKRVSPQEFLEKVQTKYYGLRPLELLYYTKAEEMELKEY